MDTYKMRWTRYMNCGSSLEQSTAMIIDSSIWIEKVASIGIYPPIGFARVGNSTEAEIGEGWYYGPEVPGRYDEPPGGFKDIHGAVKRQVLHVPL